MTTGMAFAEGAVDFKIGGFYRVTAAVTNANASTGAPTVDNDGFDTLTSAEITFKPSITLDNGIKIGAIIELEGDATGGDRIDHDTLFATGDFGHLEIGSRDSAGKRMQIGAPDVSLVSANSTSLTNFVKFDAPTTFVDNANDAQRVTYFTPTFGGFKAGVSYARDGAQGNGPVNNASTVDDVTTDIFDLGVTYNGTFGGVDLGLSARYGSADRTARAAVAPILSGTTVIHAAVTARDAAELEILGAGISLGFGAISFGGGYVEVETETATATTTEKVYDIGVSYANGPMSYSLTYAKGEPDDTTADENEVIVAAATYTVNSNFRVGAAISRYDNDLAGTADDIDGTILSLSAHFSF